MEGAPVTAATGVLGPVVAKLAALLGSNYKLRRHTRKDIKFIRCKLKSVHSILWAIWDKEILDAVSKHLKKEALDLADDMEDAVDDFILTMEPSRRNKQLMVQSKIKASPFQDFRTKVDDVSTRCSSKWKWAKNKGAESISSLFSRKTAKVNTPSNPPPPRAPFVLKDTSELIGMCRWKNRLIKYLERTMVQPQLKMASIVGMAGVGKTTLASLVYEEIGNKFQSRAFVSVTPTPNMKEVLTGILQQVGVEPFAGTEARTEEHIIHTLSNFLQDKRYLVIIDDIWHRGEWDIIRRSFPENNLGSRIVITTRIASLPGDDLDNRKLCIRMNPVWNFGKVTWDYGARGEDVAALMMNPDVVGESFDCDHPIVQMCVGVPLALLCLYSATVMVHEQHEQLGIHVKGCDVQDMIWQKVKQRGIQNTPGFEPLVESLLLGYNDLPHHMLKTCLLYCSIYPENYRFHMNDLVMRWVAQGFVHNSDSAKGYLEELANRELMMQLDEGKDPFGPAYELNPMMQNFLRQKLREDNFITCSSDITSADAHRIHRLCIDDYPVDDGVVEGLDDYPVDDGAVEEVDPLFGWDWSQIRSLVVFEGTKGCIPFEELKLVRVLDLQYHQQHLKFEKVCGYHVPGFSCEALWNDQLKNICGLPRVRHLFGLEGQGISEIPPEIGRLQYLETLQVRFTEITELPCEIGGLQQLKTLAMSLNTKLVELPNEIGDLQHLETLDLSFSRCRRLPCEIGNLNNLENLDLCYTMLEEVPREIGKLQHLKTMKVVSAMVTSLPSEIGDLQHLETLDLTYNEELTELPRVIGNLKNLKQLFLGGTNVMNVPKEITGLKMLEELYGPFNALPWEASQLSNLVEVPKCVRQACKNNDVLCQLAGEILSIGRTGSANGGLIIGTKHMRIPQWIKDHFNDLSTLDITICKLEEQGLNILREMPNLGVLTLRLEVVPREPIAISAEGFRRLKKLTVDSRMPRVVIFQERAMRSLSDLYFDFQFYGGAPANKDLRLGIRHLRRLSSVKFRCSQEWYGGAVESSPCMSAMIDVVRKEAQQHPNKIDFLVSGRKREYFWNKKSTQLQEVSSSGTGSSD